MDGFSKNELDAERTWNEAYDEAYARALRDGCSDREADVIAERVAWARLNELPDTP